MPNKEVIRKWVDALRSGGYKQGKGTLCFGDHYCCLGVLCDLGEKSGIVGKERFMDQTGFEGMFGILPGKIIEWAGLDSCNPPIKGSPLSSWNDHMAFDFNAIADLIEEEYLKEESVEQNV